MKLIQGPMLPVPALEELYSVMAAENINEVMSVSKKCFVVSSRGRTVLMGGLMASSMFSRDAYLWAKTLNGPYVRGELRQAVRIANKFIGELPFNCFIETDPENAQSCRFAEFLGFVFIREEEGRNIYSWRPLWKQYH